MVISNHVDCQRVGTSNQVLLLTLDRPDRANAYTTEMLLALSRCFEEARTDDSIRAAIVTGTGTAFCAGADLTELRARRSKDALALLSRNVFDRWAEAPWPTIAAINGPAVAGGLELALACDLRVCTPQAFFRLPEVELGLVPAAGGIRRLVAALGVSRATELVLSGRSLDASAAQSWGLVSRVDGDPMAVAVDLAESLAQRDATTVAVAKMLLREQADSAGGRAGEAIAQALLYGRQTRSENV